MSENKISYEEMGRFAMIPHSFIEDSKGMKFHSRWLYVALVYYRNTQSGDSFPSYETIRKLTGLTRKMISKGIKELEQNRWIKKKRRFGNSTIYKVQFNKIKESSAKKSSENKSDSNKETKSSGTTPYEHLFGQVK
jgi:DNA-binding transcriptional regulator YhcF (GntR family)